MEDDDYRPDLSTELPMQCSCGRTDQASCSGTGLRNHRNFPPFLHLPDENDVDLDYYDLPEGEYVCNVRRHWALVGEIVQATSFSFIRPRAQLRTHYGEKVMVNFHLEDADEPTYFTWKDLQKGRSLCILYPHRRTFLDMSEGIRQEAPGTVMVFPAGLTALTQEVDGYVRSYGSTSSVRHCFYCGKEETPERPLKKCTRCKLALYCDRDRCQLPHWKASHKKLCDNALILKNLASLDFTDFQNSQNFFDWSFECVPRENSAEKDEQEQKRSKEWRYMNNVLIPSMPDRLEALLDVIENKSAESDPVFQKALHFSDALADANMAETKVNETFLFTSLCEMLLAMTVQSCLRSQSLI